MPALYYVKLLSKSQKTWKLDCKKLDFKNEIKGAFSDRSKTRSKEHLMFNNPSARRVNLRLNILQYNYVVKSQEATRRTGRKQL